MKNKRTHGLLVILLSLCVLACMLPMAAMAVPDDVLSIMTVDDLKAFRDSVNGGNTYSGKTVTLGANLDLDGENWTPIGNSSYAFKGTFNGNNHIIYNMTISTTSRYCGLFGKIDEATITNLGIENANVSSSANDAAALVGNAKGGTITQCYVTGTVKGQGAVSGILGSTHSSSYPTQISNCYARIAIVQNGTYTDDLAGISGWNEATSVKITNCYSACTGEIRPIAGWSDGSPVSNSQFVNTYFDKTLSPNFSSAAGRTDLGRTSEQLKNESTYSDWDFTSIWTIDAEKNGGYPYLRGFTPGLIGAPGSVSITVKDSDGTPVTDARVSIKDTSDNQTSLSHQGGGIYSGTVISSNTTYDVIVNGETVGTITQTENKAASVQVTAPSLSASHTDHPVCGASCSHGASHLDATWQSWEQTDALPTDAGNYYLTKDITLKARWDVSEDINLCLNGRTITAGYNLSSYENPKTLVQVQSHAQLTVCDCSAEVGGSTGTNIFYVASGGSLRVYQGKYSGEGCAITTDGTVELYGGSYTSGSVVIDVIGFPQDGNFGKLYLCGAPTFAQTASSGNTFKAILYVGSKECVDASKYTGTGDITIYCTGVTIGETVVSSVTESNKDLFKLLSDEYSLKHENNNLILCSNHTHSYTVQTADTKYLKTRADCDHAASYYISCSCGASSKGTADEAVFTSGTALGHNYGAWESNNNGTHTRRCSNDLSHTETAACSGGTASYFSHMRCSVCAKPYGELLADTTAPSGEIAIETNTWNSFLNTITFGLFFKETQNVTITAQDDSYSHEGYTSNKAVKIEYYLSDKPLSTAQAKGISDWHIYSAPISINPNRKVIVYAKLTDHAGNETVINSNGIVLYTDAAQDTEQIHFTKLSTQDVTANVKLNDNTINRIVCGESLLTAGTDYTVKDNTITFKAAWLNSLPAGTYTLTLSYNPLGVEYGTTARNAAPAATTIQLNIQNAALTDVSVRQTGTLTYNGNPLTAAVSASAATADNTTVLFTYSASEEGTYSENVPAFTTAGSHTVYYQASALNHESISGSFTVTIAKQTITEPTIEGKTYTGSNLTADIPASSLYTVETNNGGTAKGEYDVVLKLTDDANYKWSTTEETTVTLKFTITLTDNAWTISPAIESWTYGQPANTPVYEAKFGTATVTYSGITNAGVAYSSSNVPTQAGSYTATFTIEETIDYNRLSETVDFVIETRALSVTVEVADKAYDGLNTANITSAQLNNVVNTDIVNLVNGTAAFRSVNAGNGIDIDFTAFTLSGDADVLKNYTLTQPAGVTANITNGGIPLSIPNIPHPTPMKTAG